MAKPSVTSPRACRPVARVTTPNILPYEVVAGMAEDGPFSVSLSGIVRRNGQATTSPSLALEEMGRATKAWQFTLEAGVLAGPCPYTGSARAQKQECFRIGKCGPGAFGLTGPRRHRCRRKKKNQDHRPSRCGPCGEQWVQAVITKPGTDSPSWSRSPR